MTTDDAQSPAWLLAPVSLVQDALSTVPSTTTPGAMLEKIKSGQWRIPVEAIRKVFANTLARADLETAKKAIAHLKCNLPGILFSGTFSKRKAEALQTHSGLLALDFDHLGQTLPGIKETLRTDPHVLATFISPSGDGLKVLVAIIATDEATHKACYAAAEQYFRDEYGLTTDPSGKDVSRLCFVSYDPDLFIRNGAADPFAPLTNEQDNASQDAGPEASADPNPHTDKQEPPPPELVADALRAISPNCAYSSWLQIGMALKSWDPVRGFRLWAAWSELAPSRMPKPGEPMLENKWDSFKRDGIAIGTLFHAAKAHGWQFPSGAEFFGKGEAGPSAAETEPDIVCGGNYAATEPPAPDPVIKELFDSGDKVPIIGSSKSRKTFFSLQLAIALSAGTETFITFTIAKRCRVLFINLEIKAANFHRRLYRMARNVGIDAAALTGWLFVINGRGKRITPSFILRMVAQVGADVVIIDPLYKLLSGDENSAQDMKPILSAFDSICEESGAAVIYIHHNAKGRAGDRDARDRGAGSGVLARDFDAAIYLTEHELGEDLLVLRTLARNYAPIPPSSICWEEGRFVPSNAAPIELTSATSRKTSQVTVEPSAVLEKFRDGHGARTVCETVDVIRAMGATRDQARTLYRRMVSDGLLILWKEPSLHGSTWLGAADQIKEKQVQWGESRQQKMDFSQNDGKGGDR